MRIAVVHSFYSTSQPSGENHVVQDQVLALREAGHEVLLVRQDTDELQGGLFGVKTGVNVALGNGFDPTPLLQGFEPEIVHVHNLFPNFSVRWLSDWLGPIVISLHNYRLFCSNGLLYRAGSICNQCPERGNKHAVLHACYRNSPLATIPLAVSRKRNVTDVLGQASMVVTTSELSDDVVRRYVEPQIKTCVIPNFVDDQDKSVMATTRSKRWLALGRFSSEKGFVELVQDWPDSEHLMIIGDGELAANIRESVLNKNIEIHASIPRDALRQVISESFGLVFPSRWYESDPQVVAEAMRLGLPVVAFHVNSAARLVEQTGAGEVYSDAQSLEVALDNVGRKWNTISQIARAEALSRWSKSNWVSRIEALYSDLIDRQKNGPRR